MNIFNFNIVILFQVFPEFGDKLSYFYEVYDLNNGLKNSLKTAWFAIISRSAMLNWRKSA